MSQISTLVTGNDVVTIISGEPQAEQFLLIGTVDTTNPIKSLEITIGGVTTFSVIGQQSLLSAYAKWMTKFTNTVVGLVFKVATGNIPLNTSYRLTNSGATTPAIYAYSDNGAGIPFLVSTTSINANSFQTFERFSALFVGTPANVSSYVIEFTNGWKTTVTSQELGSYFALVQATEANGYLATVAVLDNTKQTIKSVRANCTSATTFLTAKISDAAFQVLQGK